MSLTADLEGYDRLVDTLETAADQLEAIDLTEIGGDLVRAALPDTPRRRGLLAGTVRADIVAGAVLLLAGSPAVDYAGIVHAGNPWLAETLHRQADRIVDQVVDQVAAAVASIKGT